MRNLLIKTICNRYKNGLDEISTKGYISDSQGNEYFAWMDYFTDAIISWEYKLEHGEITIEEYCEALNDYQLIEVFRSQCCLEFR